MKLTLPLKYFNFLKIYAQRQILICGSLAFSSGFSVLFIMSTVPIWLRDYGITKTVIGWFSLAYLPYVFKILWAPLMDIFKVPILGKWLGHLRGWAILMQSALMVCVLLLAFVNPTEHLWLAAFLVSCIAFFAASRDTATDAYRIEVLKPEQVGPGSAMYLFGYRVGMLLSAAGGLYLSDKISWTLVYITLDIILAIGLITVLAIPEPVVQKNNDIKYNSSIKYSHSKFHVLKRRLFRATVEPFKEFMTRPCWLIILLMIPIYKLGDNFVQNMSNLFFLEIGFTKGEIAATVKGFGLIASIIGSLWGGFIVQRRGDARTMLVYGIIHLLSFGLFALQAYIGDNLLLLFVTIAITQVTSGIITTAFVSFISNLCHFNYRVTQYALFSSLRSLDKCLVFPAGWLADHLTWAAYFIITPLFGIPALIILVYIIFQQRLISIKALTLRDELTTATERKLS